MNRILFVLLVIMSVRIYAAFEKVESGALGLSLGNALVAVPSAVNAVFYNPAAINISREISAGLSFRDFYGLPGINQIDLALNFSLFKHPLALGINRYGNPIYQEYQIFLASLISLSSDMRVGISFQTYFLSITGYGTDNSYGLNLGILYALSPEINCAAVVSNINQPVIGTAREYLPQSFSLGISYFPEKQLMIAGEIFRDIRYAPDYRLGMSYRFDLPVSIRIGIQDAVKCYCVGLGTVFSTFKLDYAVQIQQILGVSHIFSISLTL